MDEQAWLLDLYKIQRYIRIIKLEQRLNDLFINIEEMGLEMTKILKTS